MSAAQWPVAGLVAFVLSLDDDSYGAAGGPAFGLACALVFAPLLLPVVGLVHSAVLTLPAVWLGRAGAGWCGRERDAGAGAGRRRALLDRLGRVPEWGWSLAGLLPVGAAWGAFAAALGAPFTTAALWIAASGVLPALNVAYCRRREQRLGRPLRKVWILSGLVSLGLCAALVGLAVVATVTGLLKEYEPPALAPEQVAGVWRSGGGDGGGDVRFRLYADRRAEVPGCPGTGTWTMAEDEVLKRPAVVVEPGGGPGAGTDPAADVRSGGSVGDADDIDVCADAQAWIVGGTGVDPELFVSEGDPDSPDVRILRKTR
ncbi:hypothetical protein IPZ68_38715 [Streptomyces arenae]|nr:hypothetical protein [Streptomyces arenae]